jgi:hypothetical protein
LLHLQNCKDLAKSFDKVHGFVPAKRPAADGRHAILAVPAQESLTHIKNKSPATHIKHFPSVYSPCQDFIGKQKNDYQNGQGDEHRA